MKKIFLTGASSGIGLATAKLLLARGDEVWGTSRDRERLSAMSGIHAVTLDLSDRNSIGAGFRGALEQAGHFDVLINNAGSGYFGPAESLSHEELVNQFQILVFGQVELIRLALPSMRNRKRGLIINVTSLASRLPVPFMATYNAAKAALASFTMSMQLELENANVCLIDVQPGDIRTSFNDAAIKRKDNNPRAAKVWNTVDRTMRGAPVPEIVAQRILRLIDGTNPPLRVTVGDVFQARIAPLIFRFLPQRLRLFSLKKYYGI